MPFGAQGPPGGGRPSGPGEFYWGLPKITRAWFTACLAATILHAVGFLSPASFYLDWGLVLHRFQAWRVVTNFCYLGKIGWPFVMSIIFMVQYSKTLEKDFQGRAAEFLWMLILGGSGIMAVNALGGFGMPFLATPLIYLTIWVWSRKHPNAQMSVFGLFNIMSAHFPWFLILLNMLMGGSPVGNLIGYFIGHLYYFFKENYPPTRDHAIFFPPRMLANLIQDEGDGPRTAAAGGAVRMGVPPFGGRGVAAGRAGAAAAAGAGGVAGGGGGTARYFTGAGNRLGGN